jgi:hypothetical protein
MHFLNVELRQRELDRERQKREWEMKERQAEEQRLADEERMRRQQEEMQLRMHHQEEEMRRRQQENTLFMQVDLIWHLILCFADFIRPCIHNSNTEVLCSNPLHWSNFC